MTYRVLADGVVALHLAFILFAVAGAWLALWRTWILWIHAPAALWAVAIELFGWTCPLTPLENRLRRLGGAAGYPEGFIEHHLLPVIYPAALTREIQLGLGVLLLAVNAALYAWLWRRRRPAART